MTIVIDLRDKLYITGEYLVEKGKIVTAYLPLDRPKIIEGFLIGKSLNYNEKIVIIVSKKVFNAIKSSISLDNRYYTIKYFGGN